MNIRLGERTAETAAENIVHYLDAQGQDARRLF